MDYDKLKKIFPFLKNADFTDPKTRKNLLLIAVAVVLIIFLVIANAVTGIEGPGGRTTVGNPVTQEQTDSVGQTSRAEKNPAKRKKVRGRKADRPLLEEEDSTVQTGAEPVKRKHELLEIPHGEDNDVLNGQNTKSVRDQQRKVNGSSYADLYRNAQEGSDEDPLAGVTDRDEDRRDKEAKREEELAKKRKFYGLDSDDEEEQQQEAVPQASQTVKRKTINRGGPASSAGTSAKPAAKAPVPDGAPSAPAVTVSVPGVDFAGGIDEFTPDVEAASADTVQEQGQEQESRVVRKNGGISSLDDWGTVDGISGLDSEDQYVTIDESKPVRVMFVREQKIMSGQRVSLRLLDDIAAEGILIPKNTHVMAQCTIGERLQIRVNNIEINGQILALGYTAFDNDGSQGLYCPESVANKSKREASTVLKDQGSSLLTSNITGVPGSLVNSGTSIVRNATGQVTAVVNAGYTFFLLKDDY